MSKISTNPIKSNTLFLCFFVINTIETIETIQSAITVLIDSCKLIMEIRGETSHTFRKLSESLDRKIRGQTHLN